MPQREGTDLNTLIIEKFAKLTEESKKVILEALIKSLSEQAKDVSDRQSTGTIIP